MDGHLSAENMENNPYAKNEPFPPKAMGSLMENALARATTPKKRKGIHSELHQVIAQMRRDFDETAKKGVGSFGFYLGILKNVPLTNIYRWLGDIESSKNLNTPTQKAKVFWWHYKVWKDPSLKEKK